MATMYDQFNSYNSSYGGAAAATPNMFGESYAGTGGSLLDPAGAAAAANTPVPGTTSTGNISTAWQTYLDDLKTTTNPEGGFFTKNADMLAFGIDAVGTLANIWKTWEATKLAKEQFKAEKEAANINLANQIMAYNTTLEDRTRHRASFNELSTADTDAYLASHRLEDRQIS